MPFPVHLSFFCVCCHCCLHSSQLVSQFAKFFHGVSKWVWKSIDFHSLINIFFLSVKNLAIVLKYSLKLTCEYAGVVWCPLAIPINCFTSRGVCKSRRGVTHITRLNISAISTMNKVDWDARISWGPFALGSASDCIVWHTHGTLIYYFWCGTGSTINGYENCALNYFLHCFL